MEYGCTTLGCAMLHGTLSCVNICTFISMYSHIITSEFFPFIRIFEFWIRKKIAEVFYKNGGNLQCIYLMNIWIKEYFLCLQCAFHHIGNHTRTWSSIWEYNCSMEICKPAPQLKKRLNKIFRKNRTKIMHWSISRMQVWISMVVFLQLQFYCSVPSTIQSSSSSLKAAKWDGNPRPPDQLRCYNKWLQMKHRVLHPAPIFFLLLSLLRIFPFFFLKCTFSSLQCKLFAAMNAIFQFIAVLSFIFATVWSNKLLLSHTYSRIWANPINSGIWPRKLNVFYKLLLGIYLFFINAIFAYTLSRDFIHIFLSAYSNIYSMTRKASGMIS